MKRKILSALLTLTMLLTLLPTTAMAVEPVTEYDLWVGGVQVTSENASDIIGAGISVSNDGKVFYEHATKTLTLDNATIDGAYEHWGAASAIYGETDLTIHLIGNNTITGTENSASSYGIYIDDDIIAGVDGKLTFTGSGSLTVSAADAPSYWSVAVFAYDTITIGDSCSITAYCGDDADTTHAFYSYEEYVLPSVPGILVAGNKNAPEAADFEVCNGNPDAFQYLRIAPGYTVTLNKNGGTVNSGNVSCYFVDTGATLPTNVTKDGHTFGGWYDNEGLAGEAVTSIASSTTGNKEYWAKWTANTPTTYTVTFNANGGDELDPASATTNASGKLASLPTPTYTGYNFLGWFDAATDGNEITTDTVFTANTEIFAQWTENQASGTGTVKVAGTDVSAGGNWLCVSNSMTTTDASDSNYNVKYDAGTSTLTLKGFTWSGTGNGIYATIALNIVLDGANSIATTNGYGIHVENNLSISGASASEDSLTVSSSSDGIFAYEAHQGYQEDIIISNATITATAGRGVGIAASKSLTITNSVINSTGSGHGLQGGAFGNDLNANPVNIALENSTITATATANDGVAIKGYPAVTGNFQWRSAADGQWVAYANTDPNFTSAKYVELKPGTPAGTPASTTYAYAYDAQRTPAFPTAVGSEITAKSFNLPLKFGSVQNGTSEKYASSYGLWTLTEVGYYGDKSSFSPEPTTYLDGVVTAVATKYGLDTDGKNGLAIHKLTDADGTHVGYGVVIAVDETNGYALFVGDLWNSSGAGYLLSKNAISATSVTFNAQQIAQSKYSVSLSSADVNFGSAQVDYTTPTAQTITVTNTGDDATGELSVSLSGGSDSKFELSAAILASIAVTSGSNTDSFTVRPKAGLAAGTYTETITVKGDKVLPVTATVTFTVTDASTPTPATLANNGYPYGKDMSGSTVKLVMDVKNATNETTYAWESSEDGEDWDAITDNDTADDAVLVLSSPASGTWYRCVVNEDDDLTSEAVQVLKDMPGSYSSYYYVSNGQQAYTVVNCGREANCTHFDVVGRVGSNWIKTSFANGWQVITDDAPDTTNGASHQNGASPHYSTEGARLDSLKFYFDPEDEYVVYIVADPADTETAFAFGADVELASTDTAAMDAIKTGGVLTSIQMVEANTKAEAEQGDAAFVIDFAKQTPTHYWLGDYSSRKVWINGTQDVVENTDSGMTASWVGLTRGNTVQFAFKVGTVATTGAVTGDTTVDSVVVRNSSISMYYALFAADGTTMVRPWIPGNGSDLVFDNTGLTSGQTEIVPSTNYVVKAVNASEFDTGNNEPENTATITSTTVTTLTPSSPPAPTTYAVTLNTNGATSCDELTSYACGVGATLPTPVKTNHSFGGWFDNEELTGEAVTTIGTNETGVKEFWAKWTPETYTVTLNTGDATSCDALTSYTYGTGAMLPTPAKTGYAFDGWYTTDTPGDSDTAVTEIGNTETGNKEYWAKWTADTYTVTLDALGGTGAPSSITVTYDGTYSNLVNPTRPSYTFAGWFTAAEGGTEVTNSTTVSITGPQTLYAHWTLKSDAELEDVTFTHAYDVQRSPAFPAKGDIITLSSFKYPLDANGTHGATNEGTWTLTEVGAYYTVKNTASDYLKSVVNGIAGNYTGITADEIVIHELKDGSTHVAYGVVVAYDAASGRAVFLGDTWNGGAGYLLATGTQTDSTNMTATAVPTDFVQTADYRITLDKTGTYTFTAATVGYADQSPVTITVTNAGSAATGELTVTLSGTNADRFTLSKGSITDIAVSGSDTFTVVPNTGLAAGTYTATVTVSGTNVVPKSFNVTFTVNAITVTFDANGGTVTPTSNTTGADGKLISLPIPTRSGSYSFKGWYTAANGGTQITTDTVFTEDTTIFARWTYTGGGSSSTPSYPVEVLTEKDDNIKTESDFRNAKSGTTVTITVTPDPYYQVEGVIVKDRNGKIIDVTENRDGTYSFKMPASKVTVEAIYAWDNPFVDVDEDAYYAPAVEWALNEGITGGTTATTFDPNAACTRAQMVTFLWRAAGSPEPITTVNPFTDVDMNSYYSKAVLWAVEQGITNGTGDGTTFSPYATCTRAQMATFLCRMEGGETGGTVNPFTDVPADVYYTDPVLWAVEQGITNGTGDNKFSPDAICTRAQMVTFLYRCLAE